MWGRSGRVKRETTTRSSVARRASGASLWLALAALTGLTSCRTAPIYDVRDFPLPRVEATTSVAAVDEAIWRAGRRVGWQIERLEPGDLRGTWRYKQHLAVVRIHHDGSRLAIRHEDSVNLLYQGQQIHRKYNVMVKRLLQAIQHELVAMLPSAA